MELVTVGISLGNSLAMHDMQGKYKQTYRRISTWRRNYIANALELP